MSSTDGCQHAECVFQDLLLQNALQLATPLLSSPLGARSREMYFYFFADHGGFCRRANQEWSREGAGAAGDRGSDCLHVAM